MCLRLFKRRRTRRDFTRKLPCFCELCGDEFDTMHDFIRHSVTHSIEDLNKAIRLGYGTVRCKTCWKSFSTAAQLDEHHCSTIIQGLSPVESTDSLESILIHDDL